MAGIALDYGRLLAKTRPEVIFLEEDYERLSSVLSILMARRSDSLSDAEVKMLTLLGLVVQDYERRRFKVGETATPRSVLLTLMEGRGQKHKDVWHLFGSRGIASEVLNGKRNISKAQAKKLAEFFKVSAEVFL